MDETARCINGCQRRIYARGWCAPCYRRARYNGEIERPNVRICSVDGCEQNVYSNGLCGRHFSRDRYYRLYAVGVVDDRPRCSETDCDRPLYARGWCKRHYTRWYGDPSRCT